MARNQSTWQAIDKWTLLMVVALAVFGWMNISGACYTPDSSETFSAFDFSNYAGKQFVWILTSTVLALIILIIDRRAYEYFAYILYAIAIVALMITPIVAQDVKGSLSFLTFGPIRIQPAEFSKFIIALTLAKYMGRDEYQLNSLRDMIIPALIILVPMFIIMIPQKETGTAIILASFILMFYREGMTGYILWIIFFIAVCAVIAIKYSLVPLPFGNGDVGILVCMLILLTIEVAFLIFEEGRIKEALFLIAGIVVYYGICLIINIWIKVNFNIISAIAVATSTLYLGFIAYKYKMQKIGFLILYCLLMIVFCFGCNIAFEKILQPHQKQRIEQLLGIIDDPTGIGYNSEQAKIALASGRFTGKGYHEGTQTQMHYVPEQHTDFIFCTVGEEWGFIGCLAVLAVYCCLLLRLIKMCERQRNKFSRIYGYCVVSILFFHIAINIGMVIGLLPVIGIPLPFFSYGGSSLWGFTILLFIFLKMDTDRVNEL